MNAVGMLLDAMDSTVVLVGAAAVVAFVSLIAVALVVMVPVRKTAFGQWAGHHTEARMDKIHDAYAARKGTKAGAS